MKKTMTVAGALLVGMLAGSALAGGGGSNAAVANLRTPGGQVAGQAQFVQQGDTLRMNVTVRGLTPGMHGLHIHQKGECAPGPDDKGKIVAFGAAGGHFDPGMSHNHDRPDVNNAQGHGGDLPMITVGADGVGRLSVSTDRLSLYGKSGILNRSIIIHAASDDYASDPAGNSGPRERCGVIRTQ